MNTSTFLTRCNPVITLVCIISSTACTVVMIWGVFAMRNDMMQVSKSNMNAHDMTSTMGAITHFPAVKSAESTDIMDMSMSDMGAMLAGKTGEDLDRAFIEWMIPHHQGAVDMAKYLTGAKHPELRALGTEIIAAQNREIAQMRQWQKDWGYTTATGTGIAETPGSAMMRDHCRTMPDMVGCEKFR